MDSNNMYQNNGYQGQDAYQGQNLYQGQDAYQGQNLYQGQNMYQGQDGYQGQNLYQGQNMYQNYNMYQPNDYMQQNQPISVLGYLGYQLLFSIPCIGFIFIIVFAIGGKSINVKNFARSYLCFMLIAIVLVFLIVTVFGAGLLAMISEFSYGF